MSGFFEQFELKEIKRRQDAAEEAERKRLQQEQDERAAAEAQAEAVRKAETRDSHDAPGSPKREAGNFEHNISTISHLCSKALDLLAGKRNNKNWFRGETNLSISHKHTQTLLSHIHVSHNQNIILLIKKHKQFDSI